MDYKEVLGLYRHLHRAAYVPEARANLPPIRISRHGLSRALKVKTGEEDPMRSRR
jgi:hypothetical protein